MKISRRNFIKTTASMALLNIGYGYIPAFSATRGFKVGERKETEDYVYYELLIRKENVNINGKTATAFTFNDNFPAPLIRLKEGKEAILKIINETDEPTSIHWHGIILPNEMDGVPGVTFAGIPPKSEFTYRFPVVQYGTYWYHSHTGFQEQLGHYGPLIIDPKEPEPFHYDRDYVVQLSDWTFENPYDVLRHLKVWEGYYNYQKRTVFDFWHDIKTRGFEWTIKERLMWAKMRMNPRDIADITASTYIYLINGLTKEDNPTFLFNPGEKIRLRFINSSATTYFDIKIPGLKMKVIQADGQNVQPVEVDEFRIAVAETYDVIIEPTEYKAYALFAETMDRSGYTMATLAPKKGMVAIPPNRRPPTTRTMKAMGGMMKMNKESKLCGNCNPMEIPNSFGIDAAMVQKKPICRIDDPGVGFENAKHKVLTYADLKSIKPFETREPERQIDIHLTGNMERFIWKMYSFDGKKWSSEFDELIETRLNERVRLVFINHTMMDHPIHLHGMWMYLQNSSGEYSPRKHTINIKPGEKLCVDIDNDALGNWAFHCHILYHMHTGMFRVLKVCE